MENPTHNLPGGQYAPPASERNASGIWSLDGDRLASVEDFAEGPSVVLVGSEQVLMLAVQLPPIANAAKRRAAVPFAIEERIAEPLEEVHVALGREIVLGTYLVGVVRHEAMRRWVRRLELADLHYASLVPDALSLPPPGPGSWSVDLAGERALVRLPDGTGSAVPLAMLGQAWRTANEPECATYGDPLPQDMHAAAVEMEAGPLAERLLHPPLDLRQGIYAPPRRPFNRLWKRVALVAAAGAAAHAAIAIADTMMLQSVAEERDAEVRLLAQNLQPNFDIGPDLSASVQNTAPPGPVAPTSLFVPLFLRTGNAIGAMEHPVEWRSVGFDSTGRSLTVEIDTAQLAGLQQAAVALRSAGLEARPGSIDTGQGRPTGTFTVTAQ